MPSQFFKTDLCSCRCARFVEGRGSFRLHKYHCALSASRFLAYSVPRPSKRRLSTSGPPQPDLPGLAQPENQQACDLYQPVRAEREMLLHVPQAPENLHGLGGPLHRQDHERHLPHQHQQGQQPIHPAYRAAFRLGRHQRVATGGEKGA